MTGIPMMLMGSGGAINAGVLVSASSFVQGGPNSSICTLKTDGTTTANLTNPNWYLPTSAGIGSSVWVKFVSASGVLWDVGPSSGVLTRLSSQVQIGWTSSGFGIRQGTATATFYSDAAGTAALGSITVSGDSEGA